MGPTYALDFEQEPWRRIEFDDLRGFFTGAYSSYEWWDDTGDDAPLRIEFTIGALRPAISTADAVDTSAGDASVQILDHSGEVVGAYPIWGVRMRYQEPGLVVVTAYAQLLAHRLAEAMWDSRRLGLPTENNSWAALPEEGREAWLEVVRVGASPVASDSRDRVIHLDGRQVTDLAGYFLALGEAVNGPGGYFGANFAAVTDCLLGGHGVEGALTLIWHDFEVARQSMTRVVQTGDGPMPCVDIAVSSLRENGVELIFP
ncbi:hypothetical protein Rhe02_19960 [Rhizocola hellebori]|uniref:Barstar (barnase inhibitor) domain-containing protein n=1 Tax=Rhizocola hellebori TaxID=1392758 RepID=A0A8J3Q501_9ACTN|nr:barstar family protein [Rhizocola hellebori]GIH03929.1 hypothetical protein Rhe02_19960 [Rhizocola hellebori]